jgi:phage protein D
VLYTLEEMVTVPIRGDRHEIADLDDLLQTPVTFSFEKTTVRAILDAVLAQAQLTYQVQADAIQLHKIGGPGRSDAP